MPLTDQQQQWVAALRSGEYAQTTNKLESLEGGFCCLGVACAILIPETRTVNSHATHPVRYDSESRFAPPKIITLLDLNGDTGEIMSPPNDGVFSLTQMNDEGWTFTEIADFIESNPQRVFKNAN